MASGNKVTSGQELEISASDFNSFIDAAKFVKQQQQNQEVNIPQTTGRSVVQVKLDDAFGAFDIIGVGDSTIDPLVDEEKYLPQFFANMVFEGTMPDIDLHLESYGVLTDAGLADDVVGCVTSGIIQAQVKVESYDHTWAVLTDGENYLTSNYGGTSKIIYKPADEDYDEGDIVWCIVRVGINPQYPPVYEATANESAGEITAKRIDSDGIMVGEEETFLVLPEGS